MQRRVWTWFGVADILFSFQADLRSMIKLEDIMTNIPSNIHDDDDFHEHMESLPPSLPSTEITNISFLITKAQLAIEFAVTLQELSTGEQIPYDRVLEIDQRLRQSYGNIAEQYKLHTLSPAERAPLRLVVSRYMLANLHYKSICVLHSRYLGLSRHNPRYLYSRRSCLEASMQILNLQAIQHEQSIARGSIHNLNEYQTSLTTHDFLLAATLVSIGLSLESNGSRFEGRSDAGPSKGELMAAIERSVHIWVYLRDRSAEAFMAADVLSMLLLKFRKEDNMRLASTGPEIEQIVKPVDGEKKPQQAQWWHKKAPGGRERPAPLDRFQHAGFDCTDTSVPAGGITAGAAERYPISRTRASVDSPALDRHGGIGSFMPEILSASSSTVVSGSSIQSQVGEKSQWHKTYHCTVQGLIVC